MKTNFVLNKFLFVALGSAAFSSLGSTAFAQSTGQNPEDAWPEARIQANGHRGELKAFSIGDGQYRIAAYPESFETTAQISGGSIDRVGTKAKFARLCEATASTMATQRDLDRTYDLIVSVNPLATQMALRGYSAGAGLSAIAPAKVANLPVIGRRQLHLKFESNAFSTSVGRLNVAATEQQLTQQLSAQDASIATSGKAKLVLAGLNDLACDLALGRAAISIEATASFDSAKLWRRPVITAAQYERVYDVVAKAEVPQATSPAAAVILTSARLALALEREMPTWFETQGAQAYVKLFTSMTGANGRVLALQKNDHLQRSRQLDIVEKNDSTMTYSVLQKAELAEK